MSFADRIRHCNSYDQARAMPLWAGAHRIGWLRRDNAEILKRHDKVFAVSGDEARLLAEGSCETVSRAVDDVVETLVAERRIPKWRSETFDIAPRWGDKPIFRLDRGAVPFFGVRAYGVHLNGYRRDGDGYSLWIGKRASNKQVAPGKLDNIVAGGIGNGYGAAATLAKEAEEEASIDAGLIARAVSVGALTYRMETKLGIRDDVMFVYDLDVPRDFAPTNGDGEIAGFELMPLSAVLERIRTTADFKFNVNLVILDFAVRHGVLRPDDPEYLEIADGLHRPLD
jgi:8-oxo-dGTP pyrophosphatase MutT (NUDIX family)